ncbi:MAG: quinate 5-dehydrogenase [Candidatus Wallbacteria bacterium]
MQKNVYSISLGSSVRNHRAKLKLLGHDINIERIGTDGDIKKACSLISELDGYADAFGLGGIDFYLSILGDKYRLPDAFKIAACARKTPIVDGCGVKNLVENKIPEILINKLKIKPHETRVFFICALNRALLAESMEKSGFKMLFGDFMSATKLPIPVHSLKTGRIFAAMVVPFVVNLLPYSFLYPVGRDQTERKERFTKYFKEADIIAGDFNYINRHAPSDLKGKTIIATTVTPENIESLRERGVKCLVTTSPLIDGRSFGANVIEAAIVAAAGRKKALCPGEYLEIINKIKFEPYVEIF